RLDEVGHERLIPIKGTPVDMLNPPEGCPLSPRCNQCMNICLRAYPAESRQSDTHSVSCWLHYKDAHAASESMPTPLSGGRHGKGGGANA
ncbi:MAG: hypothetical protein LBB86_02395, partial [Oscillospiraceae bacterium]|nr:hypothetical protein [Oscillospiraceae bacterium]